MMEEIGLSRSSVGIQGCERPRVIVIGLDGVPFEYLDPMLSEGLLPTLSTLLAHGFRAPLRSVFPPMTPVAWPSFATGKNPGKHGVFGWWTLDSSPEAPLRAVTARDVREPTLWSMLGAAGYTVGVINVPITHPAAAVNGFLISGFDNPFFEMDDQSNLSYPPGLLSRLGDLCKRLAHE